MLQGAHPTTKKKSSLTKQNSKLYGIASAEISGRYILLGFLSYFSTELGASYTQQSVIVSVRNVGRSFLQGFWGAQSDKYGRRPFLILGFVTLGLTSILYTQVRSVSLFLALVAIQMAIGSAVQPVFDSTVADTIVSSKRGAFLGKVTSFGSLVAVVALLLAGWLMDRQSMTGPDRFILPFLVGAICSFCGIILSLSLKETLQRKTTANGPQILDILRYDLKYRRLVLVTGVFFFAMSISWPLFAFVLKDVVHATGTQVSIIWTASTLMTAITTRFGGPLSDKIGRKPLLVSGRLLICLVPFFYALTSIKTTWIILLFAELIGGISVGLGMTALRLMCLDLAPIEQKAAYSGAIMSVTGITSFMGSMVAGILTQVLELSMGHIAALVFMLYIGALMRFLTSLGYFFVKETAPSKTQDL